MENIMFGVTDIRSPIISEKDLHSMKNAREGFYTPLETDIFQRNQKAFEKACQFSVIDKMKTIVGNSLLSIPPLAMAFSIASSPNPVTHILSLAIVTLGCATVSARMGKNSQRQARVRTALNKKEHEIIEHMNLQLLHKAARNYVTHNFVKDMNERVQSGKTLSISELAKLVKFTDIELKSACDKLAITVLQAKLMLAIQDGHTHCIEIPHSHDIDEQPPITDQDLVAILWSAVKDCTYKKSMSPEFENIFETMKSLHPETKESVVHNSATPNTDITIGIVFSAVAKFYVEGIKANRCIFQKPKAADYLMPIIPTKLFMPAFPEVKNLAERIERYGAHKLDLPALARQ